ncbi:MAG: NAD(P)/FAD-dependent oxidoreductase, partial [Verrucomicrobiota bacterium]
MNKPASISSWVEKDWDVIVVGAGHNGLCCATYLAQAGRKVLVVEAREKVGGACTLEETWPGYRISPCAYLCGLLHPLILQELDLTGKGFQWIPANAGLFVPFEDGESIQFWDDETYCLEEIKRLSPNDVDGWLIMKDAFNRLRERLRPPDEDDIWIGGPPSEEELNERLGDDQELHDILFHWSMAEMLDYYLEDERLQTALLGQGVIGTNASPFDRGTASINFHHSSGHMFGEPGAWGYVKGGMGTISFLLADIAREAGVEIVTGAPVARIHPEQGVELEGGDRINAPVIVSNADPKTTLKLLDANAGEGWRKRVEAIPMEGCTVKITLGLNALPDFKARPGSDRPHHRGQINTPLSKEQWQSAFDAAGSGRLPEQLWTELYIQTAAEPSIAPPGKHVMSVFAQYVPYAFAEGDWDGRRNEVKELALRTLSRFCSN